MSERRAMTLAVLLSALVHLLLLAATWSWSPLRPGTAAVTPEPPVLNVRLAPAPEPAPPSDAPTTYTSVPERLAVPKPPAEPDFLALHNAEAADRIPGGKPGERPSAPEEAPTPQVAVTPDQGAPGAVKVLPLPPGGSEGARRTPPLPLGERLAEKPAPGGAPEGRPQGEAESGAESAAAADEEAGANPAPLPDLTRLAGGGSPSILKDRPGDRGDPGFQYSQRESGPRQGNAVKFGEFSLSTVDWDFAPWLERFKQDFLPHWIPPYAYYLGVISGTTTLRLVIQRDGTLSDLEVVAEEGHPSLHQASVAAMRATAPFAPLPDDFPDPDLVLVVTLHYAPRPTTPGGEAPSRANRSGRGGRSRRGGRR